MADSKTPSKRTELFELQEDLNSNSYEKKKEAVKKVIASMTIGKDVSSLFQSVIKCLEYPQIELKKLVYLYIINYSKTKPDDAIMVVSQFCKDLKNKQNPVLRALAVRTMGCVRVPSINAYLGEPLKEALVDPEPYVRMTAALCIPKVFEISPDIIENQGLIISLQSMLSNEANAKVLSNVLVALNEMSYYRGKNLITITQKVLQKILSAINECNEWGQVIFMDYLVNYIPENSKEAEMIIERILPRLSLINPAVVFSAIKVIIKFMDFISSIEIVKHLTSKITQNLTSLISWHQPQIQYVVLKCVPHILSKRPGIMEKNIKVFFCNISEPYYIKNEKLHILAQICDNKNYESVLTEIKEYINEPDPDFVRRSITSLCTIALKFDKAVDKTIEILVGQINQIRETFRNSEPYVQEIIIAMQNIYRKYPTKIKHQNSLDAVISIIDLATEESSKAAAAWIIGEYAENIPKVSELINARITDFLQEQRGVQLNILTSAIKILLKYPEEGQHFIQKLLEMAAYKTENPDVRDRAFIYWRMLSIDTEKVRSTVISQMPSIQEDNFLNDSEFTDKMIDSLGLICSVFSKTVDELFPKRRKPASTSATKDATSSSSKPIEKSSTKENKDDNIAEEKLPEPQKEEKKQIVIEKPNIQPEVPKKVAEAPKFDLLELLDDAPAAPAFVQVQEQQQNKTSYVGGDLLEMDDPSPPLPVQVVQTSIQQVPFTVSAPQPPQVVSGGADLDLDPDFDLFDSPAQVQSNIKYQTVITSSTPGKSGNVGLQLEACIVNESNQLILKLKITNKSAVSITECVLQISPNYFGLKIQTPPQMSVGINQVFETQAQLGFIGQPNLNQLPQHPFQLVFAVKIPVLDLYFFNVPTNITNLLSEAGQLSQNDFKTQWKGIPEQNKKDQLIQSISSTYLSLPQLQQKLKENNIFFIASKNNNSYYSAKLNNILVLIDLAVPSANGGQTANVSARSADVNILQQVVSGISDLLKSQ